MQVFDAECQGGHLYPLAYVAGAHTLKTGANR